MPGNVFVTNKAPYLLWPLGNKQISLSAWYLLLASLRLVPATLCRDQSKFFHPQPFPRPPPTRTSLLWQRVVGFSGRLAAPDKRFAEWAKAVGVSRGKLHADEKAEMIDELDAVVAHFYGLDARQLRIVFETFHEGWDFEERLQATLKHFEVWKGRL